MKNFLWSVDSDGVTLNDFLRKKIPEAIGGEKISNSKIRRLIVAGAVFVDGRQCRISAWTLKKNSTVQARVDEEKLFYEKRPDDIEYTLTESDVLFEDENLIVVNKPAFIPTEGTVVADRFSMHKAVIDYLWKKNPSLRNPPYVGIMHRLDRETSGALLFTKTRTVNNAVHSIFEEHLAQKTYRAVCSGRLLIPCADSEDRFSLENFIGRISAKSAKCKIGAVDERHGGKYAKTDFHIAAKKNGLMYVDCKPLTGRTHQIRVHLSSVGLPILGDELYGGKKGFEENNGRIMLHAFSLEFPHPVTGEQLKIYAPMEKLFSPQPTNLTQKF